MASARIIAIAFKDRGGRSFEDAVFDGNELDLSVEVTERWVIVEEFIKGVWTKVTHYAADEVSSVTDQCLRQEDGA